MSWWPHFSQLWWQASARLKVLPLISRCGPARPWMKSQPRQSWKRLRSMVTTEAKRGRMHIDQRGVLSPQWEKSLSSTRTWLEWSRLMPTLRVVSMAVNVRLWSVMCRE